MKRIASDDMSSEAIVGAVDRHSNKTVLAPPTPIPGELANFARQSHITQARSVSIVAGPSVRCLRRRLSPEQIRELVARFSAGEDTPDLSRAYGISRGGRRKLLLAKGVTFRKQPMTPEDGERAVELYERGLAIDQVVEKWVIRSARSKETEEQSILEDMAIEANRMSRLVNNLLQLARSDSGRTLEA